ncbi:hypothetical protein ACLIIZ_17995 [Azonexus caeni]|jgi:hypothetical protein|uniref:hypothetical protein n=1 Tax=Azonexus caeni TaxID=266126 RepID=UPI003A8C780D
MQKRGPKRQAATAGAADDGARPSGGILPGRDNPVLLANARRVAGFCGDWPADLSPAKIAYLQYEKSDWADGKIQTLAKLIDAACRSRELSIYAYQQESWDGLCIGVVASSCRNTPEMVSMDSAPTKDGSPSHYFSIASNDFAAWWPTLKTSPSELLAAWMQVPYLASESSAPMPITIQNGWTKGIKRVVWDVSLSLEEITGSGLEDAFAKDNRIYWDEKQTQYILKDDYRDGLPDRSCQAKPGTFRSWASELKKAQGRQ